MDQNLGSNKVYGIMILTITTIIEFNMSKVLML
jgi:hypothetical protein